MAKTSLLAVALLEASRWNVCRCRYTATPAISHGKWRHSAALGELRLPFLNRAQRSVNRKVQGSNPWSGANLRLQIGRPAIHGRPLHVAIL